VVYPAGRARSASGTCIKTGALLEGLPALAQEMSIMLCTALAELGQAFAQLGAKKKALELMEGQLLPARREVFGSEHQEVLQTLCAIVQVQLDAGGQGGSSAVLHAAHAVEMSKELNGSKDPKTGSAMIILGLALNKQSRPEEALRSLEGGSAIRKAIFGDADPEVVRAKLEMEQIGRVLKAAAAAKAAQQAAAPPAAPATPK
jgi:hypothetical protein